MEGQTIVTEQSWAADRNLYGEESPSDESNVKLKQSPRSNSVDSNRSDSSSLDQSRSPAERKDVKDVSYQHQQQIRDTVIELGYGNPADTEHQHYLHGGVLHFANGVKVDNQQQPDNAHHIYASHDLYNHDLVGAGSLTPLQPVAQNYPSILEYSTVLPAQFYDGQPSYYQPNHLTAGWQASQVQYPVASYYPAPPPVNSPQYGRPWATYYTHESPGFINYQATLNNNNNIQDSASAVIPTLAHTSQLGKKNVI